MLHLIYMNSFPFLQTHVDMSKRNSDMSIALIASFFYLFLHCDHFLTKLTEAFLSGEIVKAKFFCPIKNTTTQPCKTCLYILFYSIHLLRCVEL